jgi:hypothetical protein
MNEQLDALKRRLFEKKGGKKGELTDLFDMAREFGALDAILGREFEVYDNNGGLLFKVKQKPINIKQANQVIKELNALRLSQKEAEEREAKRLRGRQ